MPKSVVFDRAVDFYDATRGLPPGEGSNVGTLLARVGGWSKQSRILEIAVGTGRIAAPVAPHVGSYIGVDLSLPMMSRVHGKAGAEAVELAQADITRLPFPDHSMDGAVAVHVFHLLEDWRGALKELKRVLRPGAVLVHARTEPWDIPKESWDEVYKEVPALNHTVGAQNREDDEFLLEEGWTLKGEMVTYEMPMQVIPHTYVDRLRQRTWSRSWVLTDEEIEKAAQALERELLKMVGNLDEPISVAMNLLAAAYLPPQG